MKKFNCLIVSAVLCLCSIFVTGCKNSELEVVTGTIVGKALYTNLDDYSGIHIFLESSLKTADSGKYAQRSSSLSTDDGMMQVTDSDGNYMFTDVPVGSYAIYASYTDTTENSVLTTVVVTENATVIASDLKLTLAGSVSGKITLDASEDANQGFTVYLGGTSYLAKTEASGSFSITEIPIGKDYEVYIEKGIYTVFWQKIDIETNKVADLGTKDITTSELAGDAVVTSGTGMVWRGSHESESEIENPKEMNTYYNSKDGCSYVYTNGEWVLLAKAGLDGEDGVDGASGAAGATGATGANGKDGKDGKDGKNGSDGKNGTPGSDGKNGVDGTGITWRGTYAASSGVTDPKELNAYYNSTDGCSYLYTGGIWVLLAKAGSAGLDGSDGTVLVWRGSHAAASEITDPAEMNAYYNSTDGCSYIYTNGDWELLAKAGSNGSDGKDGADGKDGQDGADGKDGKDGQDATPGQSGTPSVTGPKLTDFYFKKLPAKTRYNIHEEWDGSGIELEACYDDGSIKTITDYEVSGFDSRIPIYKQELILSYTEGDVTKTLNYNISYDFTWSWGDKPLKLKDEPYVYFGNFPQTYVAVAEVKTTGACVEMGGMKYELAEDGWYYYKQIQNAYTTSIYYSDGRSVAATNTNSYVYGYYRVEPIRWKILTNSYEDTGNILLQSEQILTANIEYYNTTNKDIKYNNYEYSTFRAYLNGSYKADDKQSRTYNGKGFLQRAFSEAQQNLIALTKIDNSTASTIATGGSIYDTAVYTCSDTEDKIFLLSRNEVTRAGYGFVTDADRKKRRSDYAIANKAYSGWYLRTGTNNTSSSFNQYWMGIGTSGGVSNCVSGYEIGLAPCLCIDSSKLE